MYVCYVCMYACVSIRTYVCVCGMVLSAGMPVICVYVCMCIYTYAYVCSYVYMHEHIAIHS
jgi:hypothetical protein